MKSEDIKELIGKVEKLKEEDPTNVVYIDSLELLKISYMLLEKFENCKSIDYHISFCRSDWQNFIPLGRLRSFLEELKWDGIIEHLGFALGGNGFFSVLNKTGFVNSIKNIVNEIKENISNPDGETKEEVTEEFREEVIEELNQFVSFVEKDGFLAFWKDKKVGGELKNNSEEIAKSQLMAFLTGRNAGYTAREIPAGKGYQDIIFVKDPKSPIIIETKIIQDKGKKYDEGKFQLKEYIQKNKNNEGYYVLFQTKNIYNTESYEEEGIKINQIIININQEAPTKKFREGMTP